MRLCSSVEAGTNQPGGWSCDSACSASWQATFKRACHVRSAARRGSDQWCRSHAVAGFQGHGFPRGGHARCSCRTPGCRHAITPSPPRRACMALCGQGTSSRSGRSQPMPFTPTRRRILQAGACGIVAAPLSGLAPAHAMTLETSALLNRRLFFRDPDRSSVRLSPDGRNRQEQWATRDCGPLPKDDRRDR